ncbi:hypothetical protein N9D23_05360 [Rubripirellula sp.]|nr:hypothetical protein [Planctomycetaceae bacterium]MDA9857528.1 hypothetical protein [Rubripirellula sp.]MDF1840622.1 hypothetical protein [Rubripirellula sp.]
MASDNDLTQQTPVKSTPIIIDVDLFFGSTEKHGQTIGDSEPVKSASAGLPCHV